MASDLPERSDGRVARPRVDLRVLSALLLLLLGGGLGAFLVLEDQRARAASQLDVEVLGRSITVGVTDAASQARSLARDFLREPIALTFEGQRVQRSRGELGVTVSMEALQELLADAADPRSPLRKLYRQRRTRSALALPIPAQLDAARAEPWVRAFAARVDAPAKPARVDLKSNALSAPRAGRTLDVQATLDALQSAVFVGRRQVRAVVRVSPAEKAYAPDKADFSAVVGSFESAPAPDDAGRRILLTQMARALDGALIAPGAVFDFKAQLGLQRGLAPLSMGPVSIVDGDRVEAALAQVAGTICTGALFAGLPVLEQHARVSPLSVLEPGFEAAIGRDQNLRVRNDRDVPLALTVTVHDGRVRATVRGPKSEPRHVELARRVEVVSPAPEIARPEAGMPLGARVVIQRGLPGLHVTLTRTLEGAEEQVERDMTYPPIPRVVKVGSGRAGGVSPTVRPDARPERLVDEYLALSMRPGFELPEEIARDEGRTGTPGWTAR